MAKSALEKAIEKKQRDIRARHQNLSYFSVEISMVTVTVFVKG